MLAALLAELDPAETPRALVLRANVVTFLLTLLIPLAVALITKSAASNRLKAVVTLVLSALVTLLANSQQDNGDAVLGLQTLYEWALNTVIAVVTYIGFWKPITAVNERAAPGVGITDRPAPAAPPAPAPAECPPGE